jgi:hypothetical protein
VIDGRNNEVRVKGEEGKLE